MQLNRSKFPTLFKISLDYLPIQASAVPCERVFLSAKETDTRKHNRIHPTLMEILQTLKFLFKKECLDFTDGWSMTRAEMRKERMQVADGLLSRLLSGDGDHQILTDKLLSVFDDESGELEDDGGNGGE